MSRLQKHWDLRAALNFILGGTGSGLMVAAALFIDIPDAAFALAMLLIAAGLGSVWLEIGRKLRAVHVFFNPFTSWMTRESFAALVLFVAGTAALLLHERILFQVAAVAALAFLFCQGRILHAAKGIPAWRAPQVVPLILATGFAEGFGIALFFDARPAVLAVFALAVVARVLAWRRYHAAVKSAALEPAGRTLLLLGTIVALGLAAGALAVAQLAPLAGLAGLAAAAPGWRLKLALVTRAAFKQEFSIAHLPVRGTR